MYYWGLQDIQVHQWSGNDFGSFNQNVYDTELQSARDFPRYKLYNIAWTWGGWHYPIFFSIRRVLLFPHVISCVSHTLELPLTNVLIPMDAL